MTGAKSWLTVEEAQPSTDGVRVLRVTGELDLATIGNLQSPVEQHIHPGTRILLDLEGLRFCDSTGLGAIIKLHRRVEDAGGVFALCSPGARVADVLGISGVDQVISVYPSLAAGVRALAAAS